eukprot:277094-Chlamydomonas_euryale.AAC.2
MPVPARAPGSTRQSQNCREQTGLGCSSSSSRVAHNFGVPVLDVLDVLDVASNGSACTCNKLTVAAGSARADVCCRGQSHGERPHAQNAPKTSMHLKHLEAS